MRKGRTGGIVCLLATLVGMPATSIAAGGLTPAEKSVRDDLVAMCDGIHRLPERQIMETAAACREIANRWPENSKSNGSVHATLIATSGAAIGMMSSPLMRTPGGDIKKEALTISKSVTALKGMK